VKGWVIALDWDGTVDAAGPPSTVGPPGPVPLELIRHLCDQNAVYAIGNQAMLQLLPGAGSPYGPEIPADGKHKSEALAFLSARFPNPLTRKVVVDDRPDQYVGGWGGWHFCPPERFVDFVKAEGGP